MQGFIGPETPAGLGGVRRRETRGCCRHVGRTNPPALTRSRRPWTGGVPRGCTGGKEEWLCLQNTVPIPGARGYAPGDDGSAAHRRPAFVPLGRRRTQVRACCPRGAGWEVQAERQALHAPEGRVRGGKGRRHVSHIVPCGRKSGFNAGSEHLTPAHCSNCVYLVRTLSLTKCPG